MKIATIVFGVLMLAGGVYCLLTPVATYSTLSWLIGFAMLVDGISNVITWNSRRKLGFADGWTLAGAIVSIVLGIFLLFSFVAQMAVDLFIAYLIAAWLVVGGIVRIVAAIKLRSYNQSAYADQISANWGVMLVLGILITILGVLCLFEPVAIMVGIGALLGVAIIMFGVGLIVRGVQM